MRTEASTRVLRPMNMVWSFMEHSSKSKQLVSEIKVIINPTGIAFVGQISIVTL